MIRKVLKTIKEAERDKEELDNQYEFLREKNSIHSADVKKSMNQKSKEFATKKTLRNKHFDSIRSK
ncbi:hypothetical protein [Lysinibacillus fusiformis]|uniref:hypothetical protein n=1 Tax=Lysinibacillus fusiformis TaxID=28031 RepID=UPI003D033F42